jgi:type IV pilus assembly protein PilM
MFNSDRNKTTVGLDIEAASVAAVELSVNGSTQLRRYGVESLPPGAVREGEVVDDELLTEALKELFAQNSLPKRVRLGVANQRFVVRTMLLPPIVDPKELETAIRFQAQDEIPMPLESAVLEWHVVGHRTGVNGERQVEIVVVAARREMISSLMTAMRNAGLRPAGIDLSAFAMIRALQDLASPVPSEMPAPAYEQRVAGGEAEPEQPQVPATLYCNLGDVLNLAVARGTTCLFTRMSPSGVEGMAQRLAERRGLTLEHARQWLIHVGIDRPLGLIEGDPEVVEATTAAIAEGAAKLADELRLSLQYYAAQDGAQPIESVVACGPATAIPGLVERIQHDLAYPVSVGKPAALSGLDPVLASRLTLGYGLALEE